MIKKTTKMSVIQCPLCENSDYYVVYERLPFRILRCRSCGMGFLTPVPTEKFLEQFYSQKYFRDELGKSGYKNYFEMRKSLEKESIRKLGFLGKFVKPPANLLDVGAGLGFFGNVASKKGFKVFVLDRSSWAVNYVRRHYGIPGYVSDLTATLMPAKKFQIVTAWDILEHLRKPAEGFLAINRVLRKGGWVFITTPNLDSIDAKILGKKWYGFKKIPEHLQYFSPPTIRQFATKTGFSVVNISNWGFVRNFEFMADKTKNYNETLGNILSKLVRAIGIGNLNLYFPLIDMMIVLRKEKDC